MFQVGDEIVHPMHGAGVVDDIIERDIGGDVKQYYSLRLPVGDMKVMVPVSTSQKIGVRPIVSYDIAEKVIRSIETLKIDMDCNWSRRYRSNMEKVKSGNMFLVAEVIKGLMLRDKIKSLSTGERKMLHSAKQIFISEIVLAQNVSFESVEKRLLSAVG